MAVKGLIGDPLVTGGNAVVFYIAFSASSLITFFVMLNYLMMSLQVSKDALEIKFGMKSETIGRGRIVGVRVAETKSRMSRAMSQGDRRLSKMWTVLGVGSGIELDISSSRDGARSGKTRTWFVSSREPGKLCEKLELLIATSSDSPQ